MRIDDIPHIVLDWDYDNFDTDGEGKFWLYDIEASGNPPELVYIEGWPSCGGQIKHLVARRVHEDMPYYQVLDSR